MNALGRDVPSRIVTLLLCSAMVSILSAGTSIATEPRTSPLWYELLHCCVAGLGTLLTLLLGLMPVLEGTQYGAATGHFVCAALLVQSVAVRWSAPQCVDMLRLRADTACAAALLTLGLALLLFSFLHAKAVNRIRSEQEQDERHAMRQRLLSADTLPTTHDMPMLPLEHMQHETRTRTEWWACGKRGSGTNPHDSSSYLSWLHFNYLSSYFELAPGTTRPVEATSGEGTEDGQQRGLHMKDIHALPDADDTAHWAAVFQRALQETMAEHLSSPSGIVAEGEGTGKEVHHGDNLPPRPPGKFWHPLLTTILRVFGPQWAVLGIGQAGCVTLALLGPVVLQQLLAYLQAPSLDAAASPWRGLLWAVLIAGTQGGAALVTTQFCYWTLRIQLRLRAALLAAVTRAIHEAPLAIRARITDGRLSNYVSVDVQKLQDTVSSFHQLWTLPIQVAVVLAMLHGQVNYGWSAGLAVLCLIIPLNLTVSRAIGVLTGVMMAARDERVRLTSELLTGIRQVKLLCWEGPVLGVIGEARAKEVAALGKRKYLDAVCVFLWATTPPLMALATFAAVVLVFPGSSSSLQPSVVFSTIAELNLLTFPLNALPWIYTGCLEAWVSLNRLESLLCYRPDHPSLAHKQAQGRDGVDGTKAPLPAVLAELRGVWVHPTGAAAEDTDKKDGSSASGDTVHIPLLLSSPAGDAGTRRSTSAFLLDLRPRAGSSLQLLPGTLTVVVGRIGSGKSSLLAALLGNMHPSQAQEDRPERRVGPMLSTGTTVSYAPQKAWIRRASVLDNVCMGYPVDTARVLRALRAVSLLEEVQALPHGLHSEVAASTLSGGQQQRLGLARALYVQSDLVLVDDPTSALDSSVGHHVWLRAIGCGARGKAAHAHASHTWAQFDRGQAAFLSVESRACVVVSHDPRSVSLLCPDTVIAMVDGCIAYGGPPEAMPAATAGQAGLTLAREDDERRQDQEAVMTGASVRPAPAPSPPEPVLCVTGEQVEGEEAGGEEGRETGRIDPRVIRTYARAVGVALTAVVLASLAAMQLTRNSSDTWLSIWATVRANSEASGGQGAGDSGQWSGATAYFAGLVADWPDRQLLQVFAVIVGLNCLAAVVRSLSFARAGLAACVTLHDTFLSTVTRAYMAFHDSTPAGRIINRASADMFAIDESLPFQMNIFLAQAYGLAGSLLVLAYSTSGAVLAAAPPLVACYSWLQGRYRAVSRELKRIDSVARSPLFEGFRSTLAGSAVIRASSLGRGGGGAAGPAASQLEYAAILAALDGTQRTSFASGVLGQWLALRLGWLSMALLGAVSLGAVLARVLTDPERASAGDEGGCAEHGVEGASQAVRVTASSSSYAVVAGMAGLALAYATPLVSGLQSLVSSFTETEKEMISVERVHEYGGLEVESSAAGAARAAPPWSPASGAVSITALTVRYVPYHGGGTGRSTTSSAGKVALQDVSMDVPSGARVGIIGRTGSGKSTLLACLAGLVHPCGIAAGSSIRIAGTDISTLRKEELRAAIAFIPQEPLLFSKDVRFNVDPLCMHSDDAVSAALTACGLPPTRLGPCGLQAPVEEGGRNFSVGERQLLCLARALLRGSRIVCIDEGTSAMDAASDSSMQRILRQAFQGATLLVVAHRTATLAHCDLLLKLDGGKVAYWGPAAPELLN